MIIQKILSGLLKRTRLFMSFYWMMILVVGTMSSVVIGCVNRSGVSKERTEQQESLPIQQSDDENSVDEDRYAKAMEEKDWGVVKELADKGFAKAYLPLAKHYLSDFSTHSLADKYARKGMSVNESEANEIIAVLRSYGYYD